MKNYLLTICIPTYNRAHMLGPLLNRLRDRIVDSGLTSTVQILVLDGGSQDHTPQLLKSAAGITYFRRGQRVGIDRDILKCVELADGKYCWLFSDDDDFAPDAIDYVVDFLEKNQDLTGVFCNRIPYDSFMEKPVSEVVNWPGNTLNTDKLYTKKSECFSGIGMDFGFISSQIVNRSAWQRVVSSCEFSDLTTTYYLMVHIIGKMMEKPFKWFYISKPLVKQRTGNDSLLISKGVIHRQTIEHENFDRIIRLHFHIESAEYRRFFLKMVRRLPRVIANLKAQELRFNDQTKLLKLYYRKYRHYPDFWFAAVPIFLLPNFIFKAIKKLYFDLLV
jgi:abequosyltransferase